VRLWQEAQNADIVHHHLPNPLGVVSHLLTPSRSGPTVATYHSDIVRQQTVLQAYEPLLKRFLRDVDHIILTSPRLLNHSDYLAPHAHKCTVIPLSIDVGEYERERTEDMNLPTDSDQPLLLFVGRLNYYKGLKYLIDAMQSVDASLMIVGDGERQDALETQAKELGVDDRVMFTGYVSQDRLHNYYEAADVFILPSVEPSEAFGVVQLEAMAYETPVVNTSLPTGVPWVSQDGKTGLTVEPRDSDALAVSINDLLSDHKTRKTYGRRARERVETHFSRERMLSQVESVYASILD
jgi:rhamnosyl/mannosyltransferase